MGRNINGFIKILMLTHLPSGVAVHRVARNLDHKLGALGFSRVEQTNRCPQSPRTGTDDRWCP